ncbi:MAG: Mov34/MPN/PAD-1 family protein [Clostridia bacterium]|nr:Mov34/MPN/PAD-1 family protein [Clostridia bacterium]
MAKKKGKVTKKVPVVNEPENALPQNILPIGERVEENKNIYISQKTYKDIHRFTKDKTTNESGGVLVGNVIEEFGKTNIIIKGFIEGKHCEATPTTLKFTHETWEQIHSDLEKKYPGQKILGWIHTHPDFGIFLSEYDKFIQNNFFNDENQVAYVVDPIQNIEGFYFWINGNIEKCKGFYIFDKTGVKIDSPNEKELDEEAPKKAAPTYAWKIVCGVLAVLVIMLFFMIKSRDSDIKEIKEQMNNLVDSANQSLAIQQQQIKTLDKELDELKKSLESIKSDDETTPVEDTTSSDETSAPVDDPSQTDPAETSSDTQAPTEIGTESVSTETNNTENPGDEKNE